MPNISRFHLAFPVRNLDETRAFYGDLLGCEEGRSSPHWIDFNFFGHQIVAHRSDDKETAALSEVDGERVPLRHFGVILTIPEWESLMQKLKAAGVKFIIEPEYRFKGKVGEQATCFFCDPSGNAIEIKAFADDHAVFAA
jgi:extradiol dioxygenase family protein